MIEPLTIAITATGALVVARSIQNIGAAAVRASRDVDLLNAAVSALAAGVVFEKIGSELNALQDMHNQLATVTGSVQELTQAQDALLKVAKDTRSPFEDSVQVFARVKRATQELGVSSAEAIRIVKTLNEALIVGGASGQERRSTIYQFTQALASGRLGGDELRSLLENAPILTKAIADHMGVGIGQLRALGKAGKLTTQELIESMREFARTADETFAKTTPTIQQSLTVLRTNLDGALLEFDRATDASGILSRAILSLAQHADVLTHLVVPGVLALSSAFIVARLAGTSLTSVMLGLTGTLLINPFTAALTAIAAVVALLYEYRDQIKLAEGSMLTFSDLVVGVWEEVKSDMGVVIGLFDQLAEAGGILGRMFVNSFKFPSLREFLYDSAFYIDKTIDEFNGLRDAVAAIFHSLPELLKNDLKEILNLFIAMVESAINKMIDAVNAARSIIPYQLGGTLGLPGSTPGNAGPAAFPHVDLGREAYSSEGNVFKNAADAFNAQQGKSIAALSFVVGALQKAQEVHDSFVPKPKEANALGNETSDLNVPPQPVDAKMVKGFQKDANKEMEELRRAVNAYNSVARNVDVVRAANEELSLSEAKLTEAVNMGVITEQRKNQIMETLRFTLKDNLDPQQALIDKTGEEIRFARMSNDERQIQNELLQQEIRLRKQGVDFTRKDEYEQELRQLQRVTREHQQIEQTMTSVFNRLGDALSEFVATGKLDFGSLIDSIIADLIRLVVQIEIVQPILDNLFKTKNGGGGGGGGGDFISNLLGLGDNGGGGDFFSNLFGGGSGEANGGGDFIGSASDTSFFDSLWQALPGFATGGSFDVGGSGGVDSQLVAFRATPGENVQVGQSSSGPSVVIYDQRTAKGSQPVETRRTIDADGQERLRIFIRDTVNENLQSGYHDTALNSNFGVNRRGRQA